MASRLPTPGGDDGTWGAILNDYLAQAHKTDGTLKDNSVTSAALAPGAVTATGVADGTITEAKLDTLLQAKVNVGAGGSVADATTSVKGIVQLAGDLGGTATAPTVPGLANKANSSHTHAAADITSGTIASARLGSGTANSTTYLRGDGTWAAVSGSGDASSINGVAVSGTPSAGQVLKATGASAASWQADATGGTGGFSFSPVSITADHTASNNDAIFADATSGAITITLPTPVLNGNVWVKAMDNSANSIQVVAPGASFIDDASVGSVAINVQYNSVAFWSDGTNWFRW